MAELRKDPITGAGDHLGPIELARPSDFLREPVKNAGGFLSFLSGQRGTYAAEIMAYRPNGGGRHMPGWTVRVVPQISRARHEGEPLPPR